MANFSPTGEQVPFDGLAADAPLVFTVNTVSSEIVSADDDNKFVIISNNGNFDIFLGIGATAESTKGIRISKGADKSFPLNSIPEAINAITIAGSTSVSIQVFK